MERITGDHLIVHRALLPLVADLDLFQAWELFIFGENEPRPGFMLPSAYVTNICFHPTDPSVVVQPVSREVCVVLCDV